MSQTEEDIIVLNVSTDTSGKTVVVKEQSAQNVIIVSPEAASIPAGPQGPPGQDGQPGVDGLNGQDGADGTSVTIVGNYTDTSGGDPGVIVGVSVGDGYLNNFNGHLFVWGGTSWTDVGEIRGPQGLQGPAGDSAYLAWLAVGNSGTVQDFTDSLVGPAGQDGNDGNDGNDGDTEILTQDITVFVPNASGQFIFGQFKHTDLIEANDASGNSLNKTALDIIKEALIQLGTIANPSITLTPPSVGFNSSAVSGTATISGSVPNVNQSQGSTISFELFRRTGISGSFSSVATLANQGSGSATASYSFTNSYSFDFPNLTDDPTGSHIFWKVEATESQTGQVTTSSTKSYTPTYSRPQIFAVDNTDYSDPAPDIKRVTNGLGSGSSDTNRLIYNGESNIRFQIKKNRSNVDLDKAAIIDSSGSVIGNVIDISGLLSGSTGKTTTISQLKDEGDVSIGDSFNYTVKIWDERRPYVNLTDVNTLPNGNVCDVRDNTYNVNRIGVRMVFSPTSLDDTSSNSLFQDMYDGTTSASIPTINAVEKYSEELTTTGDLVDANTSQLNLTMEVPNSQQISDFVYIFVPSYYFSDGSGGYQDLITGGGGNLNIDLIEDFGTGNNFQVIDAPPQTNQDFYLIAEGEDLQVQFGTSSNKIPYHIFRIYTALANTALREKDYLIRNVEA
jgi:hypothetical protein